MIKYFRFITSRFESDADINSKLLAKEGCCSFHMYSITIGAWVLVRLPNFKIRTISRYIVELEGITLAVVVLHKFFLFFCVYNTKGFCL